MIILKLIEHIKLFLGIIICIGVQPWAGQCRVYDENGMFLTDVFKIDRWTGTVWYYKRKDDGRGHNMFYVDESGENAVSESRKCDFTIEGIPSIRRRVLAALKVFG